MNLGCVETLTTTNGMVTLRQHMQVASCGLQTQKHIHYVLFLYSFTCNTSRTHVTCVLLSDSDSPIPVVMAGFAIRPDPTSAVPLKPFSESVWVPHFLAHCAAPLVAPGWQPCTEGMGAEHKTGFSVMSTRNKNKVAYAAFWAPFATSKISPP